MYNREQFLDSSGRPLTQSLFLETGYSSDALYTLKEVDSEYNGKVYPSIKRLYVEMADPTEYKFATEYLLSWKHWQRICENKFLRKHIDEWREELEVKLRSQATVNLINESRKGSYQAAKWVADKGWDQRTAGRPTKAEKERQEKINERVNDEYSGDVVRMFQQGK